MFHDPPVPRLGLVQRDLGDLPLGDVQPDAVAPPRLAGVVADDHRLILDPPIRAVARLHADLHVHRLAELVVAGVGLGGALQIVGVDHVVPGLRPAHPFLRREPQDRLHLRAHVDARPGPLVAVVAPFVHVGDRGELLHDEAVALLGRPQLELGLLLGRHVEPDALPMADRSPSGHGRARPPPGPRRSARPWPRAGTPRGTRHRRVGPARLRSARDRGPRDAPRSPTRRARSTLPVCSRGPPPPVGSRRSRARSRRPRCRSSPGSVPPTSGTGPWRRRGPPPPPVVR